MPLATRIIPCLDVKDGRVVKGVNFVNLVDAGDPVEQAKLYDAQGADEICFLDITASHENRGTLLDVVERTAAVCFTPLTVGGGVRTVEDVKALLRAGADKVAINSAAVRNPQLISDCAKEVGDQCIVAAIDAKRVVANPSPDAAEANQTMDPRVTPEDDELNAPALSPLHVSRRGSDRREAEGREFAANEKRPNTTAPTTAGSDAAGTKQKNKNTTAAALSRFHASKEPNTTAPASPGSDAAGTKQKWQIYTHGGRTPTGIDAIAYAKEAAERGAGEILLTSMDRDGSREGFDIALTRAITDAVSIPVVASGGVGELNHFVEGVIHGHASAVLAASVFHFGELTVSDVKTALAAAGASVRPKL